MKLAFVHVLPLEYYPPARNALKHFSGIEGWSVRAWTTKNRRGLKEWRDPAVKISRPRDVTSTSHVAIRMLMYASWHVFVATGLAVWRPDVIVAVEPHSMLAVWIYYNVFRGRARLFIHHHEYYAPEDYSNPGMRLLRSTRRLEQRDLFRRAEWVSQTNAERLALLRAWNPLISDATANVLPNYPPRRWIERAANRKHMRDPERLRLVYVGSASLNDTFIYEIGVWVARREALVSLHVTGDNISPDAWEGLRSLTAPNITLDRGGVDYELLPELLSTFDVGLILYKGNTLNFVHNVPNKTFEYLAAGLEVWYPPAMKGMRSFHREHPMLPLQTFDFDNPPEHVPPLTKLESVSGFLFACEQALEPLVTQMQNHPGSK